MNKRWALCKWGDARSNILVPPRTTSPHGTSPQPNPHQLSLENYYWDDRDRDCHGCPDGTICVQDGSTLTNLTLEKGYYRATTTSTTVDPCVTEQEFACVGGATVGQDLCAKDEDGEHLYTAHLCSRCSLGHFRDVMSNKCVSCGSSASLVVPIIFFSILLVLAIVAALLAYNTSMQAWYATRKDRITMFRDKSTMVIVTGQIVINLQSAHRFSSGGGYPTPFDQAVASADMLVG